MAKIPLRDDNVFFVGEEEELIEVARSAITHGLLNADSLISAIKQLEVLSFQGVNISNVGKEYWQLRNKVLNLQGKSNAVSELDWGDK